jgi:putative heme-binding domain-containing protein
MFLVNKLWYALAMAGLLLLSSEGMAQHARVPSSLENLLKQVPSSTLAKEIRKRGDAKRGALLFHKSAAACIQCHAIDDQQESIGPNLSSVRQRFRPSPSDEYLVESLLFPSKDIRREFRTVQIQTEDGDLLNGVIHKESDTELVLRTTNDLLKPIVLAKSTIERQTFSNRSIMPDGLLSSFYESKDFFDLAAYVFEVVSGGPARATQLQPTQEQLALKQDWQDLDHAGILKKLGSKDLETGKAIYQGYCIDCHGTDGNRPNLPTARAFGNQPLKFGADPYQMFMTITTGRGLMGAMSHLNPLQRYQVVHYIREILMKPSNPSYRPIDKPYLSSLPEGTDNGERIISIERDFGASLCSQLGRDFESVLTTKVGDWTISYDLHSMNTAGLWRGGFLNIQDTQHALARGEGTVLPAGKLEKGLQGWQWGHDGTLDYSRENVLPRGPLPEKWMRFNGYYVHSGVPILSYKIDGREILEMPSEGSLADGMDRVLELGAGNELLLGIADWSGYDANAKIVIEKDRASIELPVESGGQPSRIAIRIHGPLETRLYLDTKRRLVLSIPESQKSSQLVVSILQGPYESKVSAAAKKTPELGTLIQGGPSQWQETLTTLGYTGLEQDGYALDTLTIPESNPWNAWLRTAALDFLPDGRMLVSMYGGDLWLVDGIDDELLQLRWKRFASGLYEPLGIRVVDQQILVNCKDRIVRLHDLNGDDEADFYENVSDDTDVSVNFHAFNFDLQVDSAGYLYYAKGGHGADYSLPGAILRVSPDGKTREEFCTGFRVPNGMGIFPDGRLTCSDNQGQWMPSSKINLLKRGAFYGWSPTYNGKGKWSADGGKMDIKKVIPPSTFEPPLVWIPHEMDNSSGGQLWVDDSRWGPLSKRMLHTSFGKGWLFYLLTQDVGDTMQSAIVRLPFHFRTGIMRARVNPKDGQVYVTGLQGWNGGGRIGLLENGIQRLRYTGKPWMMLDRAWVEPGALRLDFNFDLDPNSISNPHAFKIAHWNYHWRAEYGSDRYSPSDDSVGEELLSIERVECLEGRRSLRIHIPELRPVDQLHVEMSLESSDGKAFTEEIYWTIHQVPSSAK